MNLSPFSVKVDTEDSTPSLYAAEQGCGGPSGVRNLENQEDNEFFQSILSTHFHQQALVKIKTCLSVL